MPNVVIDPGHGGSQTVGGSSPNNAKGPTGLLEKTVTLDLAQRTRSRLAGSGIDVRLTRSGDTNLGLRDRAAVARRANADAFVSIHLNGFDGRAQGTETFHHTQASSDSRALSANVQAAVLKATGLRDRGVKAADYGVLRPSSHASGTAACLVEISFMDVAAEEVRLRTEAYKDKIADALASAIRGWLIADQRIAPETIVERPLERLLGLEQLEPQDGFELHLRGEDAAVDDRPRSPALTGTPPRPEPEAEPVMNVPFLIEPGAGTGAGDGNETLAVEDLSSMLLGWRSERLPNGGEPELGLEVAIGVDDSLDAGFLEVLASRRKGVGVIRTEGVDYLGRRGRWSGTGALVAPNILMTNHHVLNSEEVAAAGEVCFDYEVDVNALGRSTTEPRSGRRYKLDPGRLFVTSPVGDGFDYSFVWVDGVEVESSVLSRMERAAFAVARQERAFIIHHPGGRPKRVSLEDTDVVSADPKAGVIHYTSDTEPGSSGAPVYDRTGRLIALHHASRRNAERVRTSDGLQPDYVNEGIKIAAIALDLEARRGKAGEPTAAIETVLGEIYGSDTLAGFFGNAGRDVAVGTGEERVVDMYKATVQDLDIGFWNIEWFANRSEEKCDDVANIIVDMGLDIWALVETSPTATERLVETIERRFGQVLECLHSEPKAPNARQTTSVIWNPRVVRGEAAAWPDEIEKLFHLRSEDFQLGPERTPPKPGKIFDRYPALFQFKAVEEVAGGIDFNLVPLHLKARDEGWERRRMASEILAHAVEAMITNHEADRDWILGGDFNAPLASGDFDALLKDRFAALSAQDEADGALTYLKSPRSLIDHVFLSPNMSRLYGQQDFFILAKEKSQVDYLKRFSDHRPVILRLSRQDEQRTESVPDEGRIGRQIAAMLGKRKRRAYA